MKKKLRILRVISSTNPAGGGPIEGIRQSQSILASRGAEIEIVCCDSPNAAWLGDTTLPIVHALGPASNKYGYTKQLYSWLKNNRHRFDVVIIHGLWQYHGFATWLALRGGTTPYYVFSHGMLDPWFKHTYPLKHLKKWLYWPWAEYRVLRDARRVVFTCEDEKILARESFWLYKVNEAVTAYGVSNPPANGEELAAKFLAQYPQLQCNRLVLYLSRIHVKKGCDLLIEAFAKVAKQDDSLHLVMAGPDQIGWVPKLQAQAEKLGIAHRITWPGMLQGEVKWGAFYAAKVFVLPSHQENFGIVVAESLACGTPVLISNKVNIWREIEADGAGLVADDTQAGADDLFNRWLSMSTEEFTAMQAKTFPCFQKHFHVEKAAERLLEIIRESN
jgi:glycosyltransferase involved in cell wall biosynthesis